MSTSLMHTVTKLVEETISDEIAEIDPSLRWIDLGVDSVEMLNVQKEMMMLFPEREQLTLTNALQDKPDLFTTYTLQETVTFLEGLLENSDTAAEEIEDEEDAAIDALEARIEKIPLLNSHFQFFAAQYAIHSPSLSSVVELTGALDLVKLKAAWQAVVMRHPVLRTKLVPPRSRTSLGNLSWMEEESPNVPDIDVEDLTTTAADKIAAVTQEKLVGYLEREWDPCQWPLHDITVKQFADDHFSLYLSVNHLVSDGIGNQIILRELLSIYQDLVNGTTTELPESLSMGEYIALSHGMNRSDDRLPEPPKSTDVHSKYLWHPKGKKIDSTEVVMQTSALQLPANQVTQLQLAANKLQVSLSAVLMSILLKGVNHLTGEKSISINMPTSGRFYDEQDISELVAGIAQNFNFTFDVSEIDTDIGKTINDIQSATQSGIADQLDRSIAKNLADAMKHVPLFDNEVPATFKTTIANSFFSNLYFSFVGESGLSNQYGDLAIANYHPATFTIRNGIDILLEQFNGEVIWSINFDSSVIDHQDIDILKQAICASADAFLNQQSEAAQSEAPGIPVLNLPLDFPRKAQQDFALESAGIDFSAIKSNRIGLSKQQDIPLSVILLTAYQVLLVRLSGQTDVSIGGKISGLDDTNLKEIAVSMELEGNPGFKGLLDTVHKNVLSADSTGSQNAFSLLFEFQNEETFIDRDGEYYDLKLCLRDIDDQLSGELKFNSLLFQQETIQRWIGHFLQLVNAIVETPESGIQALNLLTNEERQQLLTHWNDTDFEYPRDKCIHELFEAQVEKTPDAVAVIFDDPETGTEQLSYRELNAKANQVARFLIAQGVQPDTFVAVCVERSLELFIALLGIHKAGAAYVPIDPQYPKQRVAYMIENSEAKVVLSQSDLIDTLPVDASVVQSVCLDTAEVFADYATENPVIDLSPSNLAYVIFTSGSTGKPKGVMIEQQAFVSFIAAMQKEVPLQASDRWLAVTSLSFDIAGLEIFQPLMTGAAVVMVSRKTAMNPVALFNIMESQNITVLQATPSTWSLLDDLPETAKLNIHGLIGGEAAKPNLVRAMRARGVDLINVYGPTETTVWSSCYRIVDEAIDKTTYTPIGTPLANESIYLLDGQNNPVPIGVAGELLIGGDGLARGYLNRPDLTAEKFIESPLKNMGSSDRLYKTGDLCRYLPDGNIEYLGRIDDQIKIRGFRIELGEIEAVLQQHEGVSQTVVIARESAQGKRLLAYAIPTAPNDSEGSAVQLRQELLQALHAQLPEYMVPSAFMFLDAFPLTPNGKVDRKALPEPEAGDLAAQREHVSPRTHTEHKLVDIWAEVLGLESEHISVTDSFLDLGGNSLLSFKIFSRFKKAGFSVSLQDVHANQTIADLAGVADESNISPDINSDGTLPVTGSNSVVNISGDQTPARINPINSTSTQPSYSIPEEGKFSLAPAQRWLKQHFGYPYQWAGVTGFQFLDELNPEIFELAFSAVIERHSAMRTVFQESNGELYQSLVSQWDVKDLISHVDISFLGADLMEQTKADTAEQLFNELSIFNWPLCRVVCFKESSRKYTIMTVGHHMILDMFSGQILFEDLWRAYDEATVTGNATLEPEQGSVLDVVRQLEDADRQNKLDDHFRYWQSQFPTSEARFQVPLDHVKGKNLESTADSVTINLGKAVSDELFTTVKSHFGVHIYPLILTALYKALADWSGSQWVVVSHRTHGRSLGALNNYFASLGNFAVNYPTAIQMPADNDDNKLVQMIEKTIREVPMAGVSYDYLGERLGSHCYPDNKLTPVRVNFLMDRTLPQMDRFEFDEHNYDRRMAAEDSPRTTLIECFFSVEENNLQLTVNYSKNFHTRKTMQALARGWLYHIDELRNQCMETEVANFA